MTIDPQAILDASRAISERAQRAPASDAGPLVKWQNSAVELVAEMMVKREVIAAAKPVVDRKAIDLVAALRRAEQEPGTLAIVRVSETGLTITSPLQLAETDASAVVPELVDYIKGQDAEIALLHRQAHEWSEANLALTELASARHCALDVYERVIGRITALDIERTHSALTYLRARLAKLRAERSRLQVEAAALPAPAPAKAVGSFTPRLVAVPEDGS